MKKHRSARLRARLRLCSTRITVVPDSLIRRTIPMSRSTVIGAKPERQLVDHQQPRRRHHHAGQRQHLLLAARQRARRLVEPRRQLGERLERLVEGPGAPRAVAPQRVAADAQVVPHAQARERHLAAHQQGDAEVDDLLRLEVRAARAEEPDDAAVGVLQSRHRAQQGRLPGPVRAEQGHHLALRHLEVDVEEHLVGAVVEVEVVHLEGRDGPAALAPLPLGVALEHVLDHERDVTADAPRAQEQQETRRPHRPARSASGTR